MQKVTIVESSDTYGKLKCLVQKLFSMICFHFHKVLGGQIWAQTAKIEQNCSNFLIYGAICFPRKVPISLNEFYDQCLISDISFKSVRKCDFITFYHCMRLSPRLHFLIRSQNNMQNVTSVENSETYGKLKGSSSSSSQ